MNTVSLQTYTDNWVYLNKENIAPSIKQPSILEFDDSKEEDERKVEQINESNKLSSDEKATIYFNLQAVQGMKNRIEIYMNEEDDADKNLYHDIYELNRKIERNEFIQNYQNDSAKIQNGNVSFEMWA